MDFEDHLKRLTEKSAIILKLLTEMPVSHAPIVIEGLLRRGDLLLVGGKSKRWKSWARMDLLYCIANGFEWLGFKCHQGLVIHFDLELHASDVRARFEAIHQSYCQNGFKGNFDNMRFATLRGAEFNQDTLLPVSELLVPLAPIIFSLDPVYRLLGGKSENDQASVNELLNNFLSLGSTLSCAVALTQHFSKGDPNTKDPEDRFSGSGVWARFPDCLITITDLEEENCFAADFILRAFQPVQPVALRWDFPRFRIDTKLDPENLKQPKAKGGRTQKMSVDQLCSLFGNGESFSFTNLFSRAHTAFEVSESNFRNKLNLAKNQNAIFQDIHGNYGLSSSYIQNHHL